jgi:hypothetical protein
MKLVAVGLVCALAALVGCATMPAAKDPAPKWARFYLESADARANVVLLPRSGVRIAVGTQPVLAENDIVNVELMQVELGKCLMFQLTPTATRDFYRLTGANQGKRLVLTINDEPLGARRIDGALADGVVFVFAEVPEAAMLPLVAGLKKSALALQRAEAKK